MLFPLDRVLELTARGSQLNHSWMAERRVEGFNQRDTWVQESDELRARIAEANELDVVELTDDELKDLVAFLEALTDPASEDLTHEIPDEVPSGLPVDK
jgi:cytochrome c peroxidase